MKLRLIGTADGANGGTGWHQECYMYIVPAVMEKELVQLAVGGNRVIHIDDSNEGMALAVVIEALANDGNEGSGNGRESIRPYILVA